MVEEFLVWVIQVYEIGSIICKSSGLSLNELTPLIVVRVRRNMLIPRDKPRTTHRRKYQGHNLAKAIGRCRVIMYQTQRKL